MIFLKLRTPGYSLLDGSGIEIGAFEHPAILPERCKVQYCDAITPEQAKNLFPELDVSNFKNVDHIIDLNKGELNTFNENQFDFVIMNHVIEHLVNPISIIQDVYRILKKGGKLAIAIPDKNYTFDKNRVLTPFTELIDRHLQGKTEPEIYDYIDMAKYVHPQLMTLPKEKLEVHLQGFKNRREHLNIWTSATFKEFLEKSFVFLEIEMTNLYEVTSNENQFEYFGVWQK